MTSWLIDNLDYSNKEKKRCKKLYKDWVDDEFNCGPNKFIFGIMNEGNKYLNAPQNKIVSFYTLNDLQIYYNRDTQKYILDIELFTRDNESWEEYLSRLLLEFKNFINLYDKNIDIDLFNYLSDIDNYWVADSLQLLYNKFYIFVMGYKQLCRNKKQLDKKLEVNND